MKRRSQGFTLIELMVVIAVLAVLLALAAPNYRAFMLKRGVQAAVDALVSDLRYARSEALLRSQQVTVCASADGQTCLRPPDWSKGWIVFADDDGDGVVDASDRVLRVQSAPPYLASLATASVKYVITFEATGWARTAGRTFTFTPASGEAAVRIVCVSNQGRAAERPEGTTQCSV